MKHFAGLLITVLLVGVFWYSPFAPTFNGMVLDAQFQGLRALPLRDHQDDVVIVGIDEQTFETFDRPLGLWHSYIGDLLNGIGQAKPKLVVVDLVFEKLYRQLIPNHYSSLHRSLLLFRNNQVPIVMAIGLRDTVDSDTDKRVMLEEVFPYPAIQAILKDEKYFGLALIEKDPDGILRRQSMRYSKCHECSPSMLARAYQQLGQQHASGLINFAVAEKFNYLPLHEVVQWSLDSDTAKLANAFAGKSVFVGAVTRFEDRHLAPVPLTGWEKDNRNTPGVMFMAQAMRSIDAGGLIQPASPWLTVGLMIFALSLWFTARTLWLGAGTLLLGVVGLTTFSAWLLTVQQEVPTGLIVVMAMAASATRFSVEAWGSFLDRKRLTSSFGGYVSPNVMQQILDGKISPDMQGTRLNVCIMFADIRNFTTRSESSTPESIIQLLNHYFDEMTMVIDQYGGTVDKFIGDGLMVFFGAPNIIDNPSQKGFNAARGMLERLTVVNQTLQEQGLEQIDIGIGLHTGDAVIGHVGSARRNEYTAIGDTVNVAARIEGLTKSLGYSLVCSETVFRDISGSDQLVKLGSHALKGHTPLCVYGWNRQ